MTSKYVIEQILQKEKLNQKDLASLLNESQQNFNKKLRNDTFKYNDMEKIAEILKYKITWEKIDTPEVKPIQNEMLNLFNKLPIEEQYKTIGRLEEIINNLENKEPGKSSSSKTG